ncbi:MAG: sigma-70 family RNA polymerase sigma factor [Ruminococcus sp.]|uniref:RNA polymerase sigma factor n=1 Tax=Ruminococcus sp. TaxID=41978 RepID=UPI001B13110C|nr:sigma-70 family RNA polymerase sigma factor [Ruminococcus sp.]MBO7475304.1 sigma-70 family RNA polymerase sigma factor [Ruminococcus sp.]
MKQELHEIYEKYGSDLYAFILRMCRSEQLARDILQDTMLKAMQSADSFKGDCSVKTWLYTIARNLWYDHLKKAENRNSSLDTLSEPTSQESIEACFADKDTALRIHHLLHELDEPYREVFTLRVFAELKFADIAKVFGKSENWAGVTYYRAKQKLLQLLKKEGLL